MAGESTDTSTTAPAAAATEAATATTTTTATPAARTETAPPENRVPQSVLDRVTGEKWEATRRAEQAERNLALAQQTITELGNIARGEGGETTRATTGAASASAAPAERPADRRITADELQRLVNEKSAFDSFNKQCNEAVTSGRAAHADFDRVVLQQLASFSPAFDPVSARPVLPQPLVEAALETGEAHEVLYALGQDAALAERLMRLPPIKQAVEIAKFHEKLVAQRAPSTDEGEAGDEGAENEPTVSRAPPPPRTRAGQSGSNARPAFDLLDTSKSSTADWIAKREAELKAKRAGAGRR